MLAIIATVPFSLYFMTHAEIISYSNSIIGVGTFTSNYIFWSEAGYFDTASELKPLLHTWSLAVEEQFYIVFPAMLFLILKVKNKIWRGVLLTQTPFF